MTMNEDQKKGIEMNLLVSVIIPVEKETDKLTASMESLCEQSYRMFEVLLVHAYGSGESFAMCCRYAEKYPWTKVLVSSERNIRQCRNLGLDIACGDCVLFMNPGDRLRPDALEVLVRLKLDTGSDIVIGNSAHPHNPGNPEESLPALGGQLFARTLFENVRYPIKYNVNDDYVAYKLFMLSGREETAEETVFFSDPDTDDLSCEPGNTDIHLPRSLEEQVTLYELTGKETHRLCDTYVHCLKERQERLLAEGAYQDYLREKTILSVIEKYRH